MGEGGPTGQTEHVVVMVVEEEVVEEGVEDVVEEGVGGRRLRKTTSCLPVIG